MADNSFRVNKSLSLNPQSSVPTNPVNGDVYYDASQDTFVVYDNGFWINIASQIDVPSATSLNSSQFTAIVVQNPVVRITGSTTSSLYGMTASTGGKQVIIYNETNTTVTIFSGSLSEPTAANRFLTVGSTPIAVSAGDCVVAAYDDVQSNWIIVSAGTNLTVNIPDASNYLANLTLAVSVAANALTIALKTQTGVDPTSGSPVVIGFGNESGGYNSVSVTAATSIVIPSGTTIGTLSGVPATIYVYALDNAGTVEMAVSLSLFDEGVLQNTTAISGGNSATTLYSTTARTNVPVRLIGRINVTETTAGTWATAPSAVSLPPFLATREIPNVFTFTSTGTYTYTPSSGILYFIVELVAGGGGGSGNNGGEGGNVGNDSSFTAAGINLSAGAGGGGVAGQNGGAGGSPSISGSGFSVVYSVVGGQGQACSLSTGTDAGLAGGNGGNSFLGGAGGGNEINSGGNAGAANTGSGGSGAGNGTGMGVGSGFYNGSGGGAGAYIKALFKTIASSYTVTVGAGGAGGAGGGSLLPGGDGGSGVVTIIEYYQ